ncbi:MAG: hypothetical protein ABSB59_41180 [Streptosporangiaceae bacterium]
MTSWLAGVVAGELPADYSQVELHPGDGGHLFGMGDIGLANGEFGEHAILTTARQYGSIRLTVQVLDEEPALDPSWDAAVEFSLHTGESVSVTGWAGEGIIAVPLPSAADVRVRYVVLDGQAAQDQAAADDDGPERYLVQMWPGTQAPPRVAVSSSPWSQYWTFGGTAAGLLAELAGVPDPDRLVVVIDRALAAHPDVAGRLRAGDGRYRVGVIRYLQELFRITHTAGTYDDVCHDHERLGHLIDERAQLRDP